MSSYPLSATYPSTAQYPGAGVLYPSTAQYPGGGPPPFTPPAPPPVAGFTDWYESRQINLTAPFNPISGGDVPEWFSLAGSFSLPAVGAPPSYVLSGLNGLPIVDITTRQMRGNENFTGADFSFMFVAGNGVVRLDSGGDFFEVSTEFGFYAVSFQGSLIFTGPAADGQPHIQCITYDSISFTLRWWMDGLLLGVTIISLLLNGPLDLLDLGSAFAFVGYNFVLSPAQVNADGLWYSGKNSEVEPDPDAPQTGLDWPVYAQDANYWPGALQEMRATSISGNDGDPISLYPALIGFEAEQPTALLQPTLKNNIINGFPVVRFNGANQMGPTAGPALNNCTVFVVASNTGLNADYNAMVDGSIMSNRIFSGFIPGGNMGMFSNTIINGPAVSAGFHVFMYNFQDASSSFGLDGVITAASGTPGTPDTPGIILGNDSYQAIFFTGDQACVLIYDNSVFSSFAEVMAWLKSIYGTP